MQFRAFSYSRFFSDDKTVQLAYSLLPQIHKGKIDKKDFVPEMQTLLKNLSLADCFSIGKSKADGTNQTSKMKHLFAWWCVMRYLNLLGQLVRRGNVCLITLYMCVALSGGVWPLRSSALKVR